MFLSKRSSRSLCNLCAIFLSRMAVKNLVSSSVGSAPVWCSERGVAQRQRQEEPPKELVLPLLLALGECCTKWSLLKFVDVISVRGWNTWVKVIFSLFVQFQSCGAMEYKPGTSENNKGDLNILTVKKKWQHFCDRLSPSPVAVLDYLGLESFCVLYFTGFWFNFWDGYWQTLEMKVKRKLNASMISVLLLNRIRNCCETSCFIPFLIWIILVSWLRLMKSVYLPQMIYISWNLGICPIKSYFHLTSLF